MNFVYRWVTLAMFVLAMGLSGCHSSENKEEVTVVPRPLSVEKGAGSFTLTATSVIAVPGEAQQTVAGTFAALFTASSGFTPEVKVAAEGDICLQVDEKMEDEAYELKVTPDGALLKAADNRGFFYGLQSLRLMLPASVEGASGKAAQAWTIPAVTVKDKPRFAYRGFMLDVARFFMPKEDLLRMIDCMAMLKLNRLHLHLTDDNGWRLEIKKYPKLTEVGAWRVDRRPLPFPDRRNPEKGEKATVGGFYTQEEMKEVIAYAAARQIEIIPEIDIPAHSNAALAAYPEYACPVVKDFIGVLPGLGGKNAEIIFCAGNEECYHFLQGVLDEVMALFPSRYVHLGGDEATKTNWKKCPLCQRRLREERLKDEEDLQGYFMQRMSDYVRSKGKEVMGWDELTNSRLPEDVIVFGWQGMGNAALKAAEQGYRFVMTPARIAYLIRYQGPQWFEPLTYFGNNTLKGLYDYEPVQKEWKPEYRDLLMGVQASMWTEFCDRPEDVFYLVFPRLAALAEIAWIPEGTKDWGMFLKGLDNYVAHLDSKGIVYARSMYNIQHKVTPTENGELQVHLECERPDVEIRYTLDGTEPSASSLKYEKDLVLTDGNVIKSATFVKDRMMGKVLTLPLIWNKATAKPLVNPLPGMDVLVNGVRGSLKQSDFEWYSGALSQPVVVTVDLLKTTDISECSVGCITNYGMAVHKPASMVVEVSEDNVNFAEVGRTDFSKEEIFKEGNFIEELTVKSQAAKARYVRFTLNPAGVCPSDHVRPGQVSKICLDEIMIK